MDYIETPSDLSRMLKTHLKTNDLQPILSIIDDYKCGGILEENCSDLFPIITEYLTEYTRVSNFKLYDTCKTLLTIIAQKSKIQDVLIECMNIFETSREDLTICSLLPAFEICWQRVPKNRIETLRWCLDSICNYLDNIYESKDDTDENTDIRLLVLCDAIANFCINVNQHLDGDFKLMNEIEQKRNYLMLFIIKVIGKPIAFLDAKNVDIIIYNNIINTFLKLLKLFVGDIYSFLHQIDYESYDDCNILGLASVYFLLFLQSNQFYGIHVYNPNYIVRSMMYLSSVLLNKPNVNVISKGLQLSDYILNLVTSIDEYELEGTVYKSYFISLTYVVVYNESETLRKLALKNISKCILKFNNKGRYLVLQNLIPTINHSGLKGYLCTMFKDMLREALDTNGKLPIYLKGKKMYSILAMFSHLSKGAATDLLDCSDQIISALNTLRYLVIRDKDNLTEIWTYITLIEEDFLNPLRKALKISKAHYKLKLEDLNSEKKITKQDIEFEATVGDEKLPELPLNNHISAMELCLSGFDVIESLMIYLEEIIESKIRLYKNT